MSTFDALVAELTRDAHRVQPKDALQFCANWFQSRLEEQRTLTRDTWSQRAHSYSRDLPTELYIDTPFSASTAPPLPISPFSAVAPSQRSSLRDSASHPMSQRGSIAQGHSQRNSAAQSPFGTLNIPGNALLADNPTPPVFKVDGRELPPTSPLTTTNPSPFSNYDNSGPSPMDTGDYLHPPTSAIFARRTSVSAESIAVDDHSNEPLPVFPKSEEQMRRIKASISSNFIFRDLDEEQATGVLNAMQEMTTTKDQVVIRQGDVGDYFYVVESGLLHCFIRPEPLPPQWLSENATFTPEEKFLGPGYHPVFGKKVTECKPGSSFGELALMYGHPRAATVLSIEPSTLWALDRITFRTIILKAAHRRRTMYEHFLSTVPLLSSLDAAEKSKIADALVSKVYMDGEAVVKQGEMGDTFFFVEEGEATVTKRQQGEESDGRDIIVATLRKGDYFGELSLLRLAARAATVSAVYREDISQPRLKVAALDAPAFTRLLGPLREIMERQAGEQYGPGTRLTR
ncbi:hypothetical protein D9758_001188 [Tetrapyrgos nigripes]|uniref:cAMP-dependent protein kinase regulatory subunit n=1 Tax=Tetrapyrgos nigripes TaxID=182062 RepID=A0A8H5GS50_9AGAR|nr:hypothetical protein D9758_001188 [Tetrapyrgos nigripes]